MLHAASLVAGAREGGRVRESSSGCQFWLPIPHSNAGHLAAGYTFGSHAAVDADSAFSVLLTPLNLQPAHSLA
jgi:hypothetical protein